MARKRRVMTLKDLEPHEASGPAVYCRQCSCCSGNFCMIGARYLLPNSQMCNYGRRMRKLAAAREAKAK